jgi:hypothetical protein
MRVWSYITEHELLGTIGMFLLIIGFGLTKILEPN